MYPSTIEPRLIALLNNDAPAESYTTSPSLELPPLHNPNILKPSGRPLLLEPDASKRNGKPTPNTPLTPKHSGLMSSIDGDDNLHRGTEAKKKAPGITDRALGSSSPQSLRKILDDDTRTESTPCAKKRNLVESSKDDFVQLPQPPKKQKATKQVVPPIIIGLFEPPPQAALFPPIASSSFHDRHGRNSLNATPAMAKELDDNTKLENSPDTVDGRKSTEGQNHKKAGKTRKKWTEEETNNLLLGVYKHGVGRWTDILEDPSFWFNNRSGVDLKDRFRTCCPNELREKIPKPRKSAKAQENANKGANQRNFKSSLMSENILIEENEIGGNDNDADMPGTNKSRKSRTHRKRLEDLAQLGIEGPFRKSQRRERRPFSDEDDREILLGYQIYGPAWTRIQRDPRFHLQSRQPTDLRDRFRNKYPEKFRSDDATSKGASNADARELENSIATQPPATLQQSSSREGLRIHEIISDNEGTISKTLPLSSQTSNFGFKDNDSFSEQPSESADGLPPFDWNGNTSFTGSMGEMDISRLLLDESWIDPPSGKEKQSFTDINSIITSGTDGLTPVPSFYNMLVGDEQINMSSSVTLDHESSFG
jgi:hypothetical protein